MNKSGLTFGELRKYYDKLGRVSVCIKETLNYENFSRIAEVPDRYNDMYVYGFGIIDSEFTDVLTEEPVFAHCVEFMLSDTPRDFGQGGE